MSAPARQAVPRPELARDLQLPHAGAIVVGTIIGSGIFLVPTEMMQAVGSAGMVYLAWVDRADCCRSSQALTYAELGASETPSGRRVRVCTRRRVRAAGGLSLLLDLAPDCQAGLDRHGDHRPGANPWAAFRLFSFFSPAHLDCSSLADQLRTVAGWRSPPRYSSPGSIVSARRRAARRRFPALFFTLC